MQHSCSTHLKNLRDLIEYSKGGILSKELVKTKKNNITLFCMGKGTEISEHTSTKEGFVYMIEGRGMFKLRKEEIKMLPGVFIFLKKGVIHSLKTGEDTSSILAAGIARSLERG